MFLKPSLFQWGLVFAGMLIGFALGIWFALMFRDKNGRRYNK